MSIEPSFKIEYKVDNESLEKNKKRINSLVLESISFPDSVGFGLWTNIKRMEIIESLKKQNKALKEEMNNCDQTKGRLGLPMRNRQTTGKAKSVSVLYLKPLDLVIK